MTEYTVNTPYLDAIQAIPGDTPSEKRRWIAKTKVTEMQASGDVQILTKMQPLLSLIQIEKAIKGKEQMTIELALHSEDSTIINRIFRASWFFTMYKNYDDINHLRVNVFPYVSLNTRLRMVKTFALTLIRTRNADTEIFAQQMFEVIEFDYGVQQALPLTMACNENFLLKMIKRKKIVLPYKIVKTIFHWNRNFMVPYLMLTKDRRYKIDIQNYVSFLPKLIKYDMKAFVELFEKHEKELDMQLSSKYAFIFLKTGMEYVKKKPKLYIKILPLKSIKATQMETIFFGLFPEKVTEFYTNMMLNYLTYYPEDKKLNLLCETYKAKYNTELLHFNKNITAELLILLPVEERIKQARNLIRLESCGTLNEEGPMFYHEMTWICYLPTEETIPNIKKTISKASRLEDRAHLFCKIIYNCEVNKDNNALLDILLHFKDRHKNEEYYVFEKILQQLLKLYDVPHLEENIWSVLNDIIRLCYVKHGHVTEEMLLALAHYELIHGMSITRTIEMLLETQNEQSYIHLANYMLTNYPSYEKDCLLACINVIQQQYNSDNPKWKTNKKLYLHQIIVAMYDFNERCKQSRKTIEYIMTINDFPWLLNTAREDIWTEQNSYYKELKNVLIKHEFELYRDWCLMPDIDDVTSGVALKILQRDPNHILSNLEEYFTICKDYCHAKEVQHFLRATRWYKDISIKFVERCIHDLQEEQYSCLPILAILVHSESLTTLLDALIPKETTVEITEPDSRDKYKFMLSIPLISRLSNPPLPLELMTRLCKGDHMQIAVRLLTKLSRRTCLPAVKLFARNLMKNVRISIRKHGLRMMYLVATRSETKEFLQSEWNTANHYTIREIVFQQARRLFYEEPDLFNWSLFSGFISSLTHEEEKLLSELVKSPIPTYNIPPEYISKYIQLLFDMIIKQNNIRKKNSDLANLFKNISGPICNWLPRKTTAYIIECYLFYYDDYLSSVVRDFIISSYLSRNKKKLYKRFKVLKTVFVKEIKAGWNRPHTIKRYFYAVNNCVHSFVQELVRAYIEKRFNSRIIHGMLCIFKSALTPQMNAKSYLLLMYAKTWNKSLSPKAYGLRLGRIMPHLFDTFTTLFIPIISQTLMDFLEYNPLFINWSKYKANLCVMEGIIETEEARTESRFMVAFMLKSISRIEEYTTTYDELIKKLQETKDIAIKSILCDHVNEKTFNDVFSDY